MNFDFLSFKFSKFFKFSDILFFLNFPKIWANVELIAINLIIFKALPVQVWRSCCTGLTYFPPPSHCASSHITGMLPLPPSCNVLFCKIQARRLADLSSHGGPEKRYVLSLRKWNVIFVNTSNNSMVFLHNTQIPEVSPSANVNWIDTYFCQPTHPYTIYRHLFINANMTVAFLVRWNTKFDTVWMKINMLKKTESIKVNFRYIFTFSSSQNMTVLELVTTGLRLIW